MRPTTILLVEDSNLVRNVVRDTLEYEGWRVDASEDGTTALQKLESAEHYDLILTDNDLPGVSGLDLIRHARTLAHRRQTPIIMLSAIPVEKDARHAGADAFLQKPEDISKVVETIKRHLKPQSYTVLVMEDPQENAITMQQRLEARGYDVVTVKGQTEGVEAAREKLPDLILINQPYAPLNGLATGMSIREKAILSEDVPIIIIHLEELETALGSNVHITYLSESEQLKNLLSRLLPKHPD